MNVTQIGLGITLFVFGSLTLVGPATFASGLATYLLAAGTLLITGYVLMVGLRQDRYPDRS